MQQLIQHGASTSCQDAKGFNCICLALHHRTFLCAAWLLDQPFASDLLSQVTVLDETVLHVAVDAFESVESDNDALCKRVLYKLIQGCESFFDRRSFENVTAVEKAVQLQRTWFVARLSEYASASLIDSIVQRTFNSDSSLLLYANPNFLDQQLNPVLYIAAFMCDYVAMPYILAARADVNCRSPDGWTPLHVASYLGNGLICETLLENSANVHATLSSCHNCTPLQLAASTGMSNVISQLLVHGALTDSRNDLGLNAVHLALLQGHREAAFVLISSAKAAGKSSSGIADLLRTPQPPLLHRLLCSDLSEAVMMKCVNMLLVLGFHIDDTDDEGRSPLQVAISENLPLVAAALGSHAKNTSSNSRTALFSAADACDFATLKGLLSQASDLNCREFFDHGRTLLHTIVRASCRGGDSVHEGMIECLHIITCDPQCNIDAFDDQGCSPLHVAVALGSVSVSGVLLEAGAECNATSLTSSALYAAISSSHFNCVDQLLYFGANVMSPIGPHGIFSCVIAAVCIGRSIVVNAIISNVKRHHSDKLRQVCELQMAADGATLPLMWLENSKESDDVTLEVLKLLILGGSDVLQCNHSSVFPHQIATARAFYQTVHFITSIAQNRLTSIITCPSSPSNARTDILNCLSSGGRCDFADNAGLLPLHVCAAIGSVVAMEGLINSLSVQRASSINVTDSSGHNALCYAVANGRADMISLLLRSHVSQLAACGCSALAHAVLMQRLECIRALIAASNSQIGHDVITRQNPGIGVDALQLACLITDIDGVKTLLEGSSLSSSFYSAVYDDSGSIIHYVASLQLHKRTDSMLHASVAGNTTSVVTLLVSILAEAGASFLRRNSQVSDHKLT
jgi:ankyrin repeat protein